MSRAQFCIRFFQNFASSPARHLRAVRCKCCVFAVRLAAVGDLDAIALWAFARPGQGGYNRIRGTGLVERVLVEQARQHATLDDLKMMVELK